MYSAIYQERGNALANKISALLSSQQLPSQPFSDIELQHLLSQLAAADSNNFQTAGAGEREGRVANSQVRTRALGFAHGIGRSGNLLDEQPKAAGSNILHKLTLNVAKDALREAGFTAVKGLIITPMATGMSLCFAIMALKLKNVVWLRCDQKSAPKALELAGCDVTVVDCIAVDGTSMRSDYNKLEELLQTGKYDAVLSTTSCFAPRQPDDPKIVSKLCKRYKARHIVNNAYGVQSKLVMTELNACVDVDVIVSSLDKNFLVPVGGAMIYSRHDDIINQIAQKYAGRASMNDILNIFITLVQLGRTGWQELLSSRYQVFEYLKTKSGAVTVPRNEISMYVPIDKCPKLIGQRLFRSGISGCRVDERGKDLEICGATLKDFGVHGQDGIEGAVIAAALGMKAQEVDAIMDIWYQK